MSGNLIQQWKGDSTSDSQLQLWNSSHVPRPVPNSLTLDEFWLLKCDTYMRKLNCPRMGVGRSGQCQLGTSNTEQLVPASLLRAISQPLLSKRKKKESAHILSITQWRGPRQVPSTQPHSLQCTVITNLCTA